MAFFTKIFDWIAGLSAGLPSAEIKPYFICCLTFILVLGLVVGLTFLSAPAFKLKHACKKIISYLADKDEINDDNVGDFTEQCFSVKAPKALRETWIQYLGVRFGYPCDIVSERDVYEKEVKKVNNIRANVFVGISLVVLAVFAFWGFGSIASTEMSVIHFCGLALTGIIYIVLLIVGRSLTVHSRDTFYAMQEDLDSKVNFQVEKNYSTDASPLIEVAAIVDEIIAKNTSKNVDVVENEFQIDQYVYDDGIDEVLQKLDDAHKAELTPIDAAILLSYEKDNAAEKLTEPESAEIVTEDGQDGNLPQTEIAPDYFEKEQEVAVGNIVEEDTGAYGSVEDETVEEQDGTSDYFENITEDETIPEEDDYPTAEQMGEFNDDASEQNYDDSEQVDETSEYENYEDNIVGSVDETEEAVISSEEPTEDNAAEDNETITDIPSESGTQISDEYEVAEDGGNHIPLDPLDKYTKTVIDDDFFAQASERETASDEAINPADTEDAEVSEVTADYAEQQVDNGKAVDTAPVDIENQNKDGNDDMFGKKKIESNAAAEQATRTDETYGVYVESELAEKEFFEAELEPDFEPNQTAAPVTDIAPKQEEQAVSQAVEAPALEEYEEISEEPTIEEEEDSAYVGDYAETVEDNIDEEEIAESDTEPETDYSDEEATAEETEEEVSEEYDAEESLEILDETVFAVEPAAAEEEVVYVQDTVEDDDEVAPAKLAKLPLLVDYMLNMNLTRSTKIKVATLMLSAYNAYKDSPQDKAIVIQCMVKLLAALK